MTAGLARWQPRHLTMLTLNSRLPRSTTGQGQATSNGLSSERSAQPGLQEQVGAMAERAAMLCRALTWWPEVDEEVRSTADHDELVENAMWACALGGAIDLGLEMCARELARMESSVSAADPTGINDLRYLRLRLARRRFQHYKDPVEVGGPRDTFEHDVEILERCPRSLGFLRVLSDLVAEADDVESSLRIEPLLTEGMALLSDNTPIFDRIDLLDTYAHHLKVLGRPRRPPTR